MNLDDKPVPKLVFVKPTNMVTSWDDDKPSATIKGKELADMKELTTLDSFPVIFHDSIVILGPRIQIACR